MILDSINYTWIQSFQTWLTAYPSINSTATVDKYLYFIKQFYGTNSPKVDSLTKNPSTTNYPLTTLIRKDLPGKSSKPGIKLTCLQIYNSIGIFSQPWCIYGGSGLAMRC